MGTRHFEALGVHLISSAAHTDLIPDPSLIPDFAAWERLSQDEVHTHNESTRRPLNNGSLSPGCLVYLERRRELSVINETAFRTVRRIPPPKGQSQARLGNSFEFFRHLESFASFWDDTSKPNSDAAAARDDTESEPAPSDEPGKTPDDSSSDLSYFHRTGAGNQMPPEYRQNILSAFLKLVAYDFGCNVSAPRTEPRLYIASPDSSSPRSSYFSSGCTFLFRTPKTREEARSGVVEGPLAAVSARHTTSFPPPRPAPSVSTPPSGAAEPSSSSADKDSVLDLARELVAAFLTAQHRARQGKTEKRIGQDAWWATKPRWGGGPGGPIGREVEMKSGADQTIGDKDEPPPRLPSPSSHQPRPSPSPAPPEGPAGPRLDLPTGMRRPSRPTNDSSLSSKGTKRLKKSGNLPMYENYRKIRPPGPAWDSKTKYAAIGRRPGVDYDDIFIVSSLFHHISLLRVKVPDRLLDVLEGADDDGGDEGTGSAKNGPGSWGKVEVWRSQWYDFFQTDDRLEATQLLWSMMAYLMRKEDASTEGSSSQDVKMTNA